MDLLNHDFDFMKEVALSKCCRSHRLLNCRLLLQIDLAQKLIFIEVID